MMRRHRKPPKTLGYPSILGQRQAVLTTIPLRASVPPMHDLRTSSAALGPYWWPPTRRRPALAIIAAYALTKRFQRPLKEPGLAGPLRHVIQPRYEAKTALDAIDLVV